jgi:tetratricopeptide (TPR) repeat protein
MTLFRIGPTLVLLLALASPAAFAVGGSSGGSSGASASAPDPNQAYADGVKALQAGDYEKAESKFRTVIGAIPKNAEANYYMGVAKAGGGDHKGAIRYLEKAVKYDDGLYAAWDQLGRSYQAAGKADEARKTLDTLTARAAACGETCTPALITARDGLKGVVEGGASPAPGPQSLLFGPQDAPRAAYLDAVALINSGRFEQAIAGLKTLGAQIGPNADVLNYLGYASRKLGRFEVALGYYDQALALDPSHRGAREYLGELFVELRQMDKARAQLAVLDGLCPFGCPEREALADRIQAVVVGAN